MKNIISRTILIVLVSFFVSGSVNAQWLGSADSTGITYRFGNVGIGTTNPSAKLELLKLGSDILGDNLLELTSSGSKSFGLRYSADESTLIMDRNYSAAWSSVMSWDRVYGNVGIGTVSPAQKLDVSGSYAINGREIFREGSTLLIGDVDAAGGGKEVRIRVSGGDKITIKTNGNVGIGTTTPDANLEVVDAIHLDGTTNAFLDVDRAGAGNAGRIRFQTAGVDNFEIGQIGGVSGFQIADGSVNSLLTVLSSGNVGIGTTTPGAKLTIKDNGTAANTIPLLSLRQDDTGTKGLVIGNDNVDNLVYRGLRLYVGETGDGHINSYVNDAFQDLLLNYEGGNVGIGTSSPSYKLDINGNTRIYSDANTVQYIESRRSGTTYGNAALVFNAPRSTNADGETMIGRGMLRVDGQPETTNGVVYLAAGTSGLVATSPTSSFQTYLKLTASTSNTGASSNKIQFVTYGNEVKMSVLGNGNVGIGTTNPSTKIDIIHNDGVEGIRLRTNTGTENIIYSYYDDGAGSDLTHNIYTVSGNAIYNQYSAGGVLKNVFNSNGISYITGGNLGIGTTDTFGYKLAVNGTIGAKEVIVETTSLWPDYVFGEEYKLPSLNEVEAFAKTNKHLPNVPNQQEVKENGVNVGEMNVILLKKIEELTLYIIEQQKQINSLTEKVNALENE